MGERKSFLLRLDPSVHDALARWAADELRSANAQIEFLLRRALTDAGRSPSAGPLPKRGRPRKEADPPTSGEEQEKEEPDETAPQNSYGSREHDEPHRKGTGGGGRPRR
jgi:hypothetical protein